MLANFFVPILDDGWRFIAIFAAVTFLAALTGAGVAVLAVDRADPWSIYFFRDPPRGVPQDDGVLVAPADGLVQMVVDAVPPAELGLGEQPLTRVSIFLSVFDVHINRSPCAGTVDVVAYRPGKFLNAAADKASEDNERMAIALRRADGRDDRLRADRRLGGAAHRLLHQAGPGRAGGRALRPYPLRQPHRPLSAARRAVAGGAGPAHDRRRDGDGRARAGLTRNPARAVEFVVIAGTTGSRDGQRLSHPPRRLRGFSINRLIPNVLTLAALCSGLTAIRFGLQGEMRLAVIAIIVAAIFDALDGRVARRLGVTSRFGAELEFAVGLPVLRRRAGAGALSRLAQGRRCAGLGRHPDVPDVLGAAAGALQHRAAGRHAAACLDRLVLHRRAGARRRAARPDPAGGELRDRGRLAAPSRWSSARCWCWSAA